MGHLLLGLDLDNTIIDYSEVALARARALSLLPATFSGGKREVRDALRRLPDGEVLWQRLQADIYGPAIELARPYDGVLELLHNCRERGIHMAIVSHKTEFATLGPGPNLRDAARRWLRQHDILGATISESDVYFVSTREEKLGRIASLGCAVFIDDLTEVFLEPQFPRGVERWLFSPEGENPANPLVRVFRSWQAIRAALASMELRT